MIIKKILDKYRKEIYNRRIKCRTHVSVIPHLDALECNRKIGEALRSKNPFFAGRIGATEGIAIGRLLTEGFVPDKIKDQLQIGAGVFPTDDEELKKFLEIHLDVLPCADILGVMPFPYHGWVVKSYASQALVVDLHSIEPYFCEEPWSWELRGLKVLVVHPFAESILKQYSTVREKIFSNPKMLPEFSLKVIKAPQTVSGNPRGYASWSETLEALKQQVAQEDFDVAIIGCGAYGFPLAAAVKKMGKMALHLGGVTQLLFGISGRRWQLEQPRYKTIMTDAWHSPVKSERPLGWEKIEGGCYW